MNDEQRDDAPAPDGVSLFADGSQEDTAAYPTAPAAEPEAEAGAVAGTGAETLDAEHRGAQAPGGAGGFHPVNVGHLVMGIAFLGLAAVWLVLTRDDVDLADHRWLLPLPWLVAGAVGLGVSVLRPRRA